MTSPSVAFRNIAVMLAALWLLPAWPATTRSCLPLAPLKITLSGTLEPVEITTPPASPGHALNPATAHGYWLHLPSSMCVSAAPSSGRSAPLDVRKVRLLVDPAQFAQLGENAAMTVRVTGELSDLREGSGPLAIALRVGSIDGD